MAQELGGQNSPNNAGPNENAALKSEYLSEHKKRLQLLETDPEEGKKLLLNERRAAIANIETTLKEKYNLPQEKLTQMREMLEEPVKQAMHADILLGKHMKESPEFADEAEFALQQQIAQLKKTENKVCEEMLDYIAAGNGITQLREGKDSAYDLLRDLSLDITLETAYAACPTSSIKAAYEGSYPPYPNYVQRIKERLASMKQPQIENIQGQSQ